jgi:hypothetical protein
MRIMMKQLTAKLRTEDAECIVWKCDRGTIVETRRFAYFFNEVEQWTGGWIHGCAADWEPEWNKWAEKLPPTVLIREQPRAIARTSPGDG